MRKLLLLALTMLLPTTGWAINNVLIDVSGYDTVLIPKGHGKIIPLGNRYSARYPSRDQSMQFMAFFNDKNGLFVQTTDGDGNIIDWSISSDKILTITFYTGNTDVIQKSIDNNWKTAANEYKAWALGQKWAVKKKSALTNVSMIATASSPVYSYIASHVFPFIQAFQTPTAVWITQWRSHAFDTMYPDYTPKTDMYMPTLLTELKGMGSLALPYINGCLYDVNYDNNSIGPRYGIRDNNLNLVHYGVSVNLYFACMGNTYWQDLILNARASLVDADNTISEGVYYDMLAATMPRICYATNHDHVAGDPLAWQNGIIKILKNTDGVILTEGPAEIYIPYVDGFLSHLYTLDANNVPLWNAVYGDLINNFGWRLDNNTDVNALLTSINESIIYGVKAIGSPWMTQQIQDVLIKPENADILSYLSSRTVTTITGPGLRIPKSPNGVMIR